MAIEVVCVCGARPNFMKIAPLMAEFGRREDINGYLVHTGQHYDERMSKLFFEELGIPRPDINLEVGSGSHAQQTAEIMKRFESVVLERKPNLVLVVGDVNSTIACGLVAVKLGVQLAHVEAGLRSFDREMPEEINRILTDRISDLLFVTEKSGIENLRAEGVADEKMFLVGNVMIDTLMANRKKAGKSTVLETMGLKSRGYGVLTLHRPSNVDDPEVLKGLIEAFAQIQQDMPLIFPVHPRTRRNLSRFGLDERLKEMPEFRLVEPQGYLDFLKLMAESRLVLTDSGGMQEETTILGVPCMTLRENTERPITIEQGTNRLVHVTTEDILKTYREIMQSDQKAEHKVPELWDGKSAQRIAKIISESKLD